ncbi:GNAT family N-acetyltransferase [Bradyrhizobium sp. USDA 4529]
MKGCVEITRLQPSHSALLSELFERIKADPASNYFHPHEFTVSEAHRICNLAGRDRYLAMRVDERFLAYGMLRGWDEGFATPTLGIYVSPELRRTGAARAMMEFMHLNARLAGASRIRLKVYSGNIPAHKLYITLGYEFAETEGDQLVGIVRL